MDDRTALIIVDVQNDFCPGGALAVQGAHEIIKPINLVAEKIGIVITTQDWHPADHCSFIENGGVWPRHCVQNTPGAEIHSGLNLHRVSLKILKGADKHADAYSGFQGTNLNDELQKRSIRELIVVGLATDYCVKNTVLDATQAGYQTTILRDLTRAVNAKEGDSEKALQEMAQSGAVVSTLNEYLK